MTRLITCGTSYMGQEPAEAFFGLGRATSAERVIVEWPGGMQSTLSNVAANQVLTVVLETPSESLFIRGDSNADGGVDISDGIRILSFLFLGDADPGCLDAADTDDNGMVEVTDGVRVFKFLFEGGEAPAASNAFQCGPDPTADTLDCAAFASCDER